ncbi:MAG: glutathione-disulfide reductase [Nodosilinea sp.]
MAYDFDLFVIGGGSGGVAAARRAAEHGARVGLAEVSRLGGTCVNRGCVPKKLMVYASHFPEQFEAATGYGWAVGDRSFHWPTLMSAVNGEVSRLNGIYHNLLDKSGVQLFHHHARFTDEHTLAVGDVTVTAAKILIAVGGQPTRPDDIPGIEQAITSDDIFHLPEQPQHIVIIGGGYIGSEFACILRGLGSKVTQLIRADKILRGFDDDLRSEIHDAMQQRGIKIIDRIGQVTLNKSDSGMSVKVTHRASEESGSQESDTILCDVVSLAATGRSPNLQGLGLDCTGVEIKDGAIAVDPHQRTAVPHIFAVGDVTDRVNLTPVAIKEGRGFADSEFGSSPTSMDYDAIPTAVFTTPEMSTVGLTEAEAIEKFGAADIQTFSSRFRPMYYTLPNIEAKTLMKLVVQKSTDRVLGAHMVGDNAAEIIQGVAIAVKMGATKADFDATVAIHPSSAEEFVTMR